MRSENLVRIAAVCSLIGAATTLALVLIKVAPAKTFDEQVLLYQNVSYMTRLWIFFFHPQLNLIAVIGVLVLLLRKKPELVVLGALFVAIWAIVETAQHAFLIDAINLYWRSGYVKETNESMRAAYYNNIIGSEAIVDSMYFLLLYCYGIGSTLIGLALIRENLVAKISGSGYIFFGILSLTAFAVYYGGLSVFGMAINFSFSWIYPVLQPISRGLLGVWLWKSATNMAKAEIHE